MTTLGSIGKKLADWILGSDSKVLLSNNAQTGVIIPTVTNLTNAPGAGDFTATMKSSLNASTPAAVTGAVGSVTGDVGGNVVGSVASVTNRVTANSDQIAGNANAASKMAKSADAMYLGTVDDTAFAPTTTEFECDDITDAQTDRYKGRVVVFTSGNNLRVPTPILAYSLVGGRGHFTVAAMPAAPANDSELVII